MKKLLLLLLLAPGAAYSQTLQIPVDSITHKIDYQEVVNANGLSKGELYLKTHEWLARTFNSATEMVQMDDELAGKVVAKGSTAAYYPLSLGKPPFNMFYNMIITIKDGRYRYELTDFEVLEFPNNFNSLHPERITVDNLVTNPKSRKANGEYRAAPSYYLSAINNYSTIISQTLKEALAPPAQGAKSKDDF